MVSNPAATARFAQPFAFAPFSKRNPNISLASGKDSASMRSSVLPSYSAWKSRNSRDGSERPHHRAERNDGYQRYEGADDADHNDVAIAVPVRRSADREQRDHRAIVRQAVERARTDHRDAMQQRGIEPDLRRARHVGRAERVERDGQPARRRACESREH